MLRVETDLKSKRDLWIKRYVSLTSVNSYKISFLQYGLEIHVFVEWIYSNHVDLPNTLNMKYTVHLTATIYIFLNFSTLTKKGLNNTSNGQRIASSPRFCWSCKNGYNNQTRQNGSKISCSVANSLKFWRLAFLPSSWVFGQWGGRVKNLEICFQSAYFFTFKRLPKDSNLQSLGKNSHE